MSLLSLVLTLCPKEQVALPSALGRAAHAALLRAIEERDAPLAESLHAQGGTRPFTCSPLRGKRANGAVLRDVKYTLRYTTLAENVSAVVSDLFVVGGELELDGARFVIERVTRDAREHPWAAQTDYETLAAPWLLARAVPARRIELSFGSPTAFRSQDKAQIFPQPEWVFGSLLEKWNAFAPMALPEETRRFALECLAVSRIHLSSRAAPFKSDGAVKFGAVGTVTYAALNQDRYWLSLMNLLADFALFAGVGTSTALGMGQCKRLMDEEVKGDEVKR